MTESDTGADVCREKRRLSERAYDAIHEVVDGAAYCTNFVLAFLMVLIAVHHIYGIMSGDTAARITPIIGNTIMLICGLAIILDRKRDLPRSVGLFAVGMGLYRAFLALGYLYPHSRLNILYYLIIALGLNMAFSGRAYLMGSSRARTMMMRSATVFMLMAMIYIIYLYSDSHDIAKIVRENANTVLLGLMYFTFIMILDSEKLRRLDWLAVHNRTVDGIRRTYSINNDAVMLYSDARKLANGLTSAEGWAYTTDGGPVSRELRFDILNGDGMTSVIAQIWHGCEGIHLTMTDHLDGTIIQASRVRVCEVVVDEDHVAMMSTNGTMLRLGLTEEFR